MRYIYLVIGVVFVVLGVFYFQYSKEASLTTGCSFCGFHKSTASGHLISIVEPKGPMVHGHVILYVQRHFNALDLIHPLEKKELVEALSAIDKHYLVSYGAIGHTYFANVSSSGHLFFDVIPKMGVAFYCYFGVKRILRSFQLKNVDLLLNATPVESSGSSLGADKSSSGRT